jgi:glycosyltransferase involved in cell wall biosynthesis
VALFLKVITGSMKISICLASYNGEKYIGDQIESIIKQLGEKDELIISDDSSSDKTLAIINNFNDPRISVFPGNTYHNPIFNFENALKQSTGEVIVLSDQDDIWLEGKLDIIRHRFQNDPLKIQTIVLDGLVINEAGMVIQDSIFEWHASGKGLLKNIKQNTYMGCCMAFSRRLLKIALPFPRKIPMHDSWIGLLSEIFGTVEFIPVKSIKYRKHEMNKSLQGFSLKQKICWRYFLVINLFKKWLLYKIQK